MAWLVVEDPSRGDAPFALEDRTVLGRELDCALRDVFAERTWVSRRHACVEKRGDGFFVTDLGSRNGTSLNGTPLAGWTRLHEGDRLEIGGVELRFRERDPADAAPVPTSPGGDGLGEQGILTSRKVAKWGTGATFVGESGAERKLRSLVQMLGNLGRSLEADEMLDHLLAGLFEIFPQADRGFVGTREREGRPVEMRKVQRRDDTIEDSVLVSRTIVERALREQEAILSIDARADDRFSMSESVTLGNIRSVMCAPLLDEEGRAFGVLELDALDPQKHFGPDDLEVFACVAPQASLTLGYARLHQEALEHETLERDLALARRVQQALLPPRSPTIEGYAFHAFYEAAYQVGGDYYDYVPLAHGRWGILIADAFGKGVSASLLATKLSSELRTYLSTTSSPSEAVGRMSESLGDLSEDLPCRFVTLALLVLDPVRHTLEVVNAGHLVPLVHRADGTVEAPGEKTRGPALGMFPEKTYESYEIALEPGDVAMVYSDGFSEAMNASHELYGFDRLRATFAAAKGSAEEQGETILADVRAFVAGERQSDDMCLLCIGRGTARRSE